MTSPAEVRCLAVALRAMATEAKKPHWTNSTSSCALSHRGCAMRRAADVLDEFADHMVSLAVSEGVTA